jgi:hypothetical protein
MKTKKDNQKEKATGNNRGIITFEDTPFFGWRAYEDNILIGSSTWLMKGGKKVCSYNGWDIFSRTTPIHEMLCSPRTYFHATCISWSEKKNRFHLHDHNCGKSMEEIKDAIDYWNQHYMEKPAQDNTEK